MFQHFNLHADSGILYFCNEYRPVPLSQTFIGVRGNNKSCDKNAMDEVCLCKKSI